MTYLRNKRTGEIIKVPDTAPRTVGTPDPTKIAGAAKAQNEADASVYAAPTAAADLRGRTLSNTKTVGDIANQNRVARQNPISEKDQTFINQMRDDSSSMPEFIGQLQAAAKAVDRFNPSPNRGAMFGSVMPEDNDWPTTALAKGFGRWFTSDQAQEDYQTLRALQEGQALVKQQAQKGPQTEGDVARIKASGVSPTKNVGPNALLLAEAYYNARLQQIKPEFYTKWANSFGSVNAPNHEGKTAGEVWAEIYQNGLKKMRQGKGYRAAQGGQRSDDQNSGAKFLGWEK